MEMRASLNCFPTGNLFAECPVPIHVPLSTVSCSMRDRGSRSVQLLLSSVFPTCAWVSRGVGISTRICLIRAYKEGGLPCTHPSEQRRTASRLSSLSHLLRTHPCRQWSPSLTVHVILCSRSSTGTLVDMRSLGLGSGEQLCSVNFTRVSIGLEATPKHTDFNL